MRTTALFLCLFLLGCSSGMERLYLAPPMAGVPSNLQERFRAEGFDLRRASVRSSKGLGYTCATRYFLIEFSAQNGEAALAVARHADAIYQDIAGWLQFQIRTPIQVTIMSSQLGTMRYQANSRIPGFTQSRYGNILLVPEDALRPSRFAHRVAQLFLRRVLHEQPVPWWFKAGLSAYLANRDQINPIFRRQVLQQALQLEISHWDQLVRTDAQGRHPPEKYLASLSVILFLIDRYGEDRLRRLLGTYSREFYRTTFRKLFERHYKPQSQLEREWKEYLKSVGPPGGAGAIEIERLPEQP